MAQPWEERREFIKGVLRSGEQRIYSHKQLMDVCNQAGFEVNLRESITTDLDKIGAVKTKPPGKGRYYYVLPHSLGADSAVKEAEGYHLLHERMWPHGIEVTDVTQMTMLLIRTAPQAGPFVAAPLDAYRPDGVKAVIAGPDSVLLLVEPERVERVKLELAHMTSRPAG